MSCIVLMIPCCDLLQYLLSHLPSSLWCYILLLCNFLFLLCCTACPGAPASPNIVSNVPPTSTLSWSSPSSSGWSFTYEVRMTNGNSIVPRQSSTTAQISGLQAETLYTVVIFAFPVSTLCPSQSRMFTFLRSQC